MILDFKYCKDIDANLGLPYFLIMGNTVFIRCYFDVYKKWKAVLQSSEQRNDLSNIKLKENASS